MTYKSDTSGLITTVL